MKFDHGAEDMWHFYAMGDDDRVTDDATLVPRVSQGHSVWLSRRAPAPN
jgi:hypothetical protein